MATVEKTENAFAATGNFPFNPDVIIDDEFACVTERNPDVVHQLPRMPDSGIVDASATGRANMANESELLYLSAFKVVIMIHHFCYQQQE
jgi:hypothetical protein